MRHTRATVFTLAAVAGDTLTTLRHDLATHEAACRARREERIAARLRAQGFSAEARAYLRLAARDRQDARVRKGA